MADRFPELSESDFQKIITKNKLGDRTVKHSQLLDSVVAKYPDLSVSRRSIICLSLRLRQITDLLATDKSQYFAQPHPIIVNCCKKILVKVLFISRSWLFNPI